MTGEPTFFEIGVADAARARAFYGGLFGYRISTPTVPGGMHGDDNDPDPK